MQQAARVSDRTGFFWLNDQKAGILAEYRLHGPDLHEPAGPAHGGLHHGTVRVKVDSTARDERAQGGAMPREKFEHDLQRLQDEILALGAMAERAVAESVQALKKQGHGQGAQHHG